MLIITRRKGEDLRIGDDITIRVVDIQTNTQVRLGIDAPREVPILRDELAKSDRSDGDAQSDAPSHSFGDHDGTA